MDSPEQSGFLKSLSHKIYGTLLIITLKDKIEKHIHLDMEQELFDQINELYIDSRYPTDLGLLPDGKPSKETAEKFFTVADEIHKSIREYLSEQEQAAEEVRHEEVRNAEN